MIRLLAVALALLVGAPEALAQTAALPGEDAHTAEPAVTPYYGAHVLVGYVGGASGGAVTVVRSSVGQHFASGLGLGVRIDVGTNPLAGLGAFVEAGPEARYERPLGRGVGLHLHGSTTALFAGGARAGSAFGFRRAETSAMALVSRRVPLGGSFALVPVAGVSGRTGHWFHGAADPLGLEGTYAALDALVGVAVEFEVFGRTLAVPAALPVSLLRSGLQRRGSAAGLSRADVDAFIQARHGSNRLGS